MKNTVLTALALLLLSSSSLFAQKVWTDPVEPTATDSVTIYVDLSQMDCQSLVGDPGPMYMWSWMPADPVVGNGDWTNSNDALVMVNDGPNIWKKTILPTDFYGVDASTVYDNDISFLVKAKDGGSGGDCSVGGGEFKTEDLMVELEPPATGPRKVTTFPEPLPGDTLALTQDDIFTLVYDNSLEEKPTMQNADDLYVYARAYNQNGVRYRPSALSQIGSNPDLQMTRDGTTFRWTIQPRALFDVPDGETIDYMQLQVVKPVINNSDDAVDGNFIYFLRCQ